MYEIKDRRCHQMRLGWAKLTALRHRDQITKYVLHYINFFFFHYSCSYFYIIWFVDSNNVQQCYHVNYIRRTPLMLIVKMISRHGSLHCKHFSDQTFTFRRELLKLSRHSSKVSFRFYSSARRATIHHITHVLLQCVHHHHRSYASTQKFPGRATDTAPRPPPSPLVIIVRKISRRRLFLTAPFWLAFKNLLFVSRHRHRGHLHHDTARQCVCDTIRKAQLEAAE